MSGKSVETYGRFWSLYAALKDVVIPTTVDKIWKARIHIYAGGPRTSTGVENSEFISVI